jgi:hypothetical protein
MTRSPSVREVALMPGSNDQLASTPPGVDQVSPREPDPVRPREPDPVIAELRERLERLPPAHPSSPYNDDGSRKPPPPDLSVYELPIPGDPDYRPERSRAPKPDRPTNEAWEGAGDRQHTDDEVVADEGSTRDREADRSLCAEDRPRNGPDGSWEWKSYALTPDQSELADQGLAGCRDVEGRDQSGTYGHRGLTPAMRRIEAQLDHSELAPDSEKFALKGTDRFKEKFAKLIQRHPGERPEKLLNLIHDAIRYTFLSDTEDYATGVWEATDNLQGHGYELIARINNWGDAEYKGVNTRWRDHESGLLFEVQFRTPESRDAKQQTHEAYEQINDVRTPVAEVERLRQHQREVSAQIPMPPGWRSIPDYRKENK